MFAALPLAAGAISVFGSVETASRQACDGPAAWAWARTSDEPCHSDAIDQFLGGLLFAAAGVMPAGVLVHLRRVTRRIGAIGVDGATPATSHSATVDSLRRRRRTGALITAAGGVMVTVFVFGAIELESRADNLADGASLTTGSVIEPSLPWYRHIITDPIGIEFVVDGDRYTAIVHLNDSSPDYRVGDTIDVLYLPDNPSTATIVGEDNDPPSLILPLLIALMVGPVVFGQGVIHLARVTRWRRIARRLPWRPRTAELYVILESRNTGWLLRPADETAPIKLVGVRTRDFDGLLGEEDTSEVEVWLAGSAEIGWVVSPPGGRVIGGARSARSAREQRRWERMVTEANADALAAEADPSAFEARVVTTRWWRRSSRPETHPR